MGRLNDKRRNSSSGQSPLRTNSTNSDIIRPSTLEYESMTVKKMKFDTEDVDAMSEASSTSTGDQSGKSSWSKLFQRTDPNSIAQESSSTRSRASSRASMSSESETRSDISSLPRSPRTPYEAETDPAVLARRMKQIEYGKNTLEYHNYTQAIPKEDRCPFHPKTPPIRRKYSRRAWDGLIKQWRLNLHIWTDPTQRKSSSKDEDNDEDEEDEDNAEAEASTTTKGEDEEESEEIDSDSKNQVKYTSWSEEVEEFEEESKLYNDL